MQKIVIFETENEKNNKMAFCRKCGYKMPPDSIFCPKCGTKIISVNDNPQESVNYNTQEIDTEDRKSIKDFGVELPDLEMIYVQGGTFEMGSNAKYAEEYGEASFLDENMTFADLEAQHMVTLDDFYIGKYPVTQRLWKAVMSNNQETDNLSKKRKDDKFPVTVSWYQTQKFIRKLNRMTGRKFRLLTEAEWEYAARGGIKSKGYKYSGTNNIDDIIYSKRKPVGLLKPNELGIFDMSNDITEWCLDKYSMYYYKQSPKMNPQGPEESLWRVIRGGHHSVYMHDGWNLDGWGHGHGIGFRLAISNPNEEIIYEDKIPEEDFIENSLQHLEMVYVEGGTFQMGGTEYPDYYEKNEIDAEPHTVSLDNFYIGKYPVTQKIWEEIMDYNPSNFKGEYLPVESVFWSDVQEFIKKLNRITGKEYRLPTEAEWEYAARGGKKSNHYKYSGSNDLDEVGWYELNTNYSTKPVGLKKANELGLHDMSGNVDEWCHDKYLKDYYKYSPKKNPKGPKSGKRQVNRGGSFYTKPKGLTASVFFRGSSGYDEASHATGFRLALSADSQNTETIEEIPISQESLNEIFQDMALVEGGTLRIEDNEPANGQQQSVEQIHVNTFYLSKHEFTQELWEKIMGYNPSKFRGPFLPVESISFDDVQEFLGKLNKISGKNYRLPTSEEWEYAARGGNKCKGYEYSGSNNFDEVAWYNENSENTTHPVGQKRGNELDLYDMCGNVFEMTGTFGDIGDIDIRGGWWGENAYWCTLQRGGDISTPDEQREDTGFRLAHDY